MEADTQLPGLDALANGVSRVEIFKRPLVPDGNVSGPVLALGDGAAEAGVSQWMVLDPDRQPLDRWVQRRLLRYRPTLEHAVRFKSEIIVQPGGVVLLDDEDGLRMVPAPCPSLVRA